MKKLYLMVFGGMICSQITAQTLVTTQTVTKGIVYKKYTAAGPNTVHVLQIDLTDPTVKIQGTKSGNVIDGAGQTVKLQASNKDNNGAYHNVVGAINADFFNTTTFNSLNLNVHDGQVFTSKYLNPKRSVFGISDTNNPFFGLPTETYQATRVATGSSLAINKVNGSRETNNLNLYNQYKGASTGTNSFGTELKLVLTAGQVWKTNGTVQCSVALKQVLVGNMAFSAGQAVLSGNGAGKTYLDAFNVGDIVNLQLNNFGGVSNITTLVGGYPKILTNGDANVAEDNILSEGGTADQNTTLNPRTGVAVNQSETTMWMVVCDGSVIGSPGPNVGMTMVQFGGFMAFLGGYNGINLDGGSSSTMIANNVLKNIPTYAGAGGERPVGSALLVWSRAQLFDDFEAGEGHFAIKTPADGGSVGISTTSTLDRITSGAYSGGACERAVLFDNTTITTPWVVRLMSGDGVPTGNTSIQSTGTFGVWLKTSTAQSGAKIHLRFDDPDGGTEETPGLTILNDGQWHQYNFDLNYTTGGTGLSGGNGVLGANVTFESIILKQVNTASTWTVDFDEISHDKVGTNPGVMLMSGKETMEVSAEPNTAQIAIAGTAGLETPGITPVLYANPNNGNFTIDFKMLQNYDVQIVNIQGAKVYSTKVYAASQTFNAEDLPDGIYFVNIRSEAYSKTLKMLIKK